MLFSTSAMDSKDAIQPQSERRKRLRSKSQKCHRKRPHAQLGGSLLVVVGSEVSRLAELANSYLKPSLPVHTPILGD